MGNEESNEHLKIFFSGDTFFFLPQARHTHRSHPLTLLLIGVVALLKYLSTNERPLRLYWDLVDLVFAVGRDYGFIIFYIQDGMLVFITMLCCVQKMICLAHNFGHQRAWNLFQLGSSEGPFGHRDGIVVESVMIEMYVRTGQWRGGKLEIEKGSALLFVITFYCRN